MNKTLLHDQLDGLSKRIGALYTPSPLGEAPEIVRILDGLVGVLIEAEIRKERKCYAQYQDIVNP